MLDHLVDLEGLCKLEPFAHIDPETVKGVLEENARFVSEVIAPLNRVGDTQGSQHQPDNTVVTPDGFREAYQAYVAAGWGAVPFEPAYGGGGFPWLVGIVMQEFISSANMAFSMCPLLTQGAIDMLRHHGDEIQRETYLPKMVTGEWTGTMNLTEPEAGSDVGRCAPGPCPPTTARGGSPAPRSSSRSASTTWPTTSSTWCWPAPRTRPRAPRASPASSCPSSWSTTTARLGERNDVTCVSIEHKMGIKASPTCVMSYGDGGGAVGLPDR